MFFVLVVIETVFVNCPVSSFSSLPFALLPSFFGPYIFLLMPLPGDHMTTGPEPQDQRTTGPEDHRTRGPGPQDQRTRGPQGQRSLNFFSRGCKYFFQGK